MIKTIVLLDITVMINIVNENMLKAIDLYWFHYDASEKNNSLNGHSKEPQLN